MKRRRGSVLIAVLWSMVLLEVTVVALLHAAQRELRVVKNHGDSIQARYLALAGVEKAKALIYQEREDLKSRGASFSSSLVDASHAFRDVPFGRGTFRVFHASTGPGGIAYGISDEESRLNANTASLEELKKLPGMTDDVAAAIADWRDDDNKPTPQGAEVEEYATRSPPIRPRNGPFPTMREMLMVRGVTPELFLGEDVNANGLLDPNEDDGPSSFPTDNANRVLDAGWSGFLTVESAVEDIDARGRARVNVQRDSEDRLAEVQGLSRDVAKAIVAYRGQKTLENLGQLLDVTAPVQQQPQGAPAAAPPAPDATQGAPTAANVYEAAPVETPPPPQPVSRRERGSSGEPAAAPAPESAGGAQQPGSGPKVVTEAILKEIADGITASRDREQTGVVNINSASAAVLSCLPGITPEIAQAIVAQRSSGGPFATIAHLLDVPGVSPEVFKQVCPRITVRSGTFRILAEGRVDGSRVRQRVEVVVRLGSFGFDTLAYREDL